MGGLINRFLRRADRTLKRAQASQEAAKKHQEMVAKQIEAYDAVRQARLINEKNKQDFESKSRDPRMRNPNDALPIDEWMPKIR